ncbi:hypothetical protein CSA80_03020 [Candidatus Saccharibacteria bacterium]|nr:MAG: hypothetical protein CSA80_03020 [Candidatus Saccharibacteria bacterium]
MKKVVYVFIDAANLWEVQKAKAKLLDLAKLKKYLKSEHKAAEIKVYYYDAYPKEGTRDHSVSSKHNFYVYLKKGLKFIVRTKPLKQIIIDAKLGTVIEKGNMDVEMSIDVVNQINKYDEAIFFSGDSDFLALIRFIHSRNKKVYIYSSRNNISSELRTGGDGYKDTLKIKSNIWRKDIKRRD